VPCSTMPVQRKDLTTADSFAQQLQMSPDVTFGDYLLCLNFYRKLDEKKFRLLLERELNRLLREMPPISRHS
jgi:hypothetical protein